MSVLLAPFRVLVRWPVQSQLHSRRNAMIAYTAMVQRRAEIIEVEEFLASRAAAAEVETTGQQSSRPAAHS
jgi:hypothetical protein